MNQKRIALYSLVVAVIALAALGLVMLSSTGAFARDSHGDPHFFVKRQMIWMALGVTACVVAACTDYAFWRKTWWIWFALAAVLLALCFVPGIGLKINGARRWIGLGPLRFQPSDLAKLAAVIFLAHWYARHEKEAGQLWTGFLAPSCVVGGLLALIALEIDMGTTALIGGTMLVVMFVAGAGLRYIAPITIAGILATLWVGTQLKGRSGRLTAFLDLEKYKEGAGLQQWHALIAFGSGGVSGLGLGNGREKHGFLPFAHTDFIMPMIGEELGLRFTLLVVFCYVVIVLAGAFIALRARDRFGMLLGFGLVVMIALQAALNIGVTTAMLPNKGLPLPLISYGGSNLAFCLLGVGILISIYRHGVVDPPNTKVAARLHARVRMTPRI